MGFENDAFINYASIDNRADAEGREGWVASLHRALQTRLAQLVGREARVWWDPEIRGNEVFSDILMTRLRQVASLVSIVSPGYINSKRARLELAEFCRAADEQGGLQVVNQARVFKVLKTSVPHDQLPEELKPFLGYEFYKIDPDSGRVQELSEIFGPEAEREFWIKLDDLAHDLSRLLELVDQDNAAAVVGTLRTVFLAETTTDLRAERDALRRSLQQHGYTVLPARNLPLEYAELVASVTDELARSSMSIHMFGCTYGLVPEGGAASLPEIQNELAAAHGSGAFERLIWIPQDLSVADDRQGRLLERLRLADGIGPYTDLLETSFEDFKTLVATRLEERTPASRPAKSDIASVYLVYDRRDDAVVTPWVDWLCHSFEVIHPIFEGDERELREAHEEALRTADGVVLLFGAGNEAWLRRKLTEIQKSPGYGRTKAAPEVCICLLPPRTPAKERFRTHHARVVPQWDGCDATVLQLFAEALTTRKVETPTTRRVGRAGRSPLVNPFPGLRPFDADEDNLFFGRDAHVDELVRRLQANRFMAILGTSGCGKSSLIRCGLVPSLHSGQMVKAGSSWRIAVLRPGGDPFTSLATALAESTVLGQPAPPAAVPGATIVEVTLRRGKRGLIEAVREARLPAAQNLLVVVDQFEELFRFQRSRDVADARGEAIAFVKVLLEAKHQTDVPVYVVLTMRSDFIDECVEYPGLPEALNAGQYLVPRMARDELRAAIMGPVAVAGAEIAPRLVWRLLNEVGSDQDQLPVLQHALMRTWDRWATRPEPRGALDLEDYEDVGGMRDALSRHAEEALEEAGPGRGHVVAEKVFRALTDVVTDARGRRRPCAMSELSAVAEATMAEVAHVVEIFRRSGRCFLMPPVPTPLKHDTIVDLSHESLMRCWGRLRAWAEAERAAAGVYLRLTQAATRHEDGTAGLWRDPELELGLKWRAEHRPTAAWARRYDDSFERAMRFLEESERESDR